jgi:hypothetical protein
MKISIKKTLLIAAALVFIGTGVSFAQSRNPGHSGNNLRGHAGNNSHGYAAGQFHKNPAYRAPNFRTNRYAYRNPRHAARPYYGKRYYPRKNYKHYNNYRYYQRYPSHNTFFFGFSVR